MAGRGTVVVKITGEADALKKSLDDADKHVKTFGEKLDGFGKKAVSVGSKMTVGLTGPILAMGGVAVKSASDFQESLSKVESVFGDWSIDVEQMAESAAKNMGLSKTAALDAAGAFGNMFTQLGIGKDVAFDMSKGMLQLAADFASFHNADISEVIDAQSAAFRGEYDSLQRFLPLINGATVEQKALEMTGKKATDELTAQDKALAVNALMHEGAGKAAGDFARTQDGLANQTRIAKAEMENASITMGQALQPITEKLTGFVAGLAEKFGNMSPQVQNTILVIGGLLAVLGPLITLIGSLSVAMAFLAANPIVLIIAGIAGLAYGLYLCYQKSETFRDVVNLVFETVVNTIGDAVGFILDYFATWIGGFATVAEAAAKIPIIGEKFVGVAETIRGVEHTLREWADTAHTGIDLVTSDAERLKKALAGVAMDTGNLLSQTSGIRPMGGGGDFGGARAAGGPVSAGRAYLVGERGPEIFVPGASGGIVPGGGAPVVVNVVLDRRVLGRAVVDMLHDQQSRTGVAVVG